MAFDDFYRVSSHAVITDANDNVLLLKATYGSLGWGLPGGSLDPGETIHEALLRECKEELGLDVKVLYMSGMYFHKDFNAHAAIFRCEIAENSQIILSPEHSDFKYFALEELSLRHYVRVIDCLQFDGIVKSAKL